MSKLSQYIEHTVVFNQGTGYRTEMFEGRSHYVCPVVMMTPGVYKANLGSVLYNEEELSKPVASWNGRPITAYHPRDEAGELKPANDSSTLEVYKIGTVFNAAYEDKLVAEAWIDVERTRHTDERIVKAIENNQPVEVSIAVFIEEEENEGVFNERPYEKIARGMQPDHLAVLFDKKGACTLADGAGLLVAELFEEEKLDEGLIDAYKVRGRELVANQLSHTEIHSQLRSHFDTLNQFREVYIWIEAVYDSEVVVSLDETFYRFAYTTTDDVVSVDASSLTMVRKQVDYVVNEESFPAEKELDMDKQKMVTAIVANSSVFREEDNDRLLALEDAELAQLHKTFTANEEPGEPVADPAPAAEAPDKSTQWADFVQTAPPEFQMVINEGVASMNRERGELMKAVLKDGEGIYDEEDLKGMQLAPLRKLAKLAGNAAKQPMPVAVVAPDFFGSAGFTPAFNEAEEIGGGALELPSTMIASA